MFCHCICILKGNEHYQQDSRALHHTFVSTCWQFSCLRLGQIFEIEPAVRQCLAIKWWYAVILLLRYWCFAIVYVYERAMDTISRILGPSIALLCPLVGGSLAYSDWVRVFSKLSQLFGNVWPSSGGMLSFCFLDSDVLPMYMYNKGQWTLSAGF